MAFGNNLLSQDPVDWSVIGGSMVVSSISLNAGGTATIQLSTDDVATIPEQFYVSIIATSYTDVYNPTAYIVITVHTALNYYEYSAPLVDTGNGYCTLIIPVDTTDFTYLSFSIRSGFSVVLSDFVLAIPVTDSVDLEGIREEIPKILDDYNTAAFVIQQEEVTIGFITANVLQNTDMNGHFLLTYTATAAAILTIRIKDNETTELYTPILYNIIPGRNSIGIPHAYVRKLTGIHTFAVTAQVDTGTISIVTRGMLFTIDGGYMAKRLIDIDVNIADLTMRQLITELEPSFVYAVGLEDNMARVRYRTFKGAAATVWEPIYEVGPAIAAAIEFNGSWIERTTDLGYTLVTEDVPWVFWITPEGVLFAQRGTAEATLMQLDTGVSTVSAVRGFKSYLTPESDQGLVVVYLKSGVAYYRAYATQANGTTVWESPYQITVAGSDITSAYISRLNDYRLALSICSASGNKLFYTERTFAGQAFKSDRAAVSDASVMSIIYENILRTNLTHEELIKNTDAFVSFQYGASIQATLPILILFEASVDNKTIDMQFDCDFYGIDGANVADIGVSPTNSLVAISRPSENKLHMIFLNAVDTSGAISLTFAGSQQIGYLRGGPNWFSGSVWTISFTTPAPTENSEHATITDSFVLSFDYSEITTSAAGFTNDHATIPDATVTLTAFYAVGSVPI